MRETYNFAPTFCFFVPNYAANMLNRSYWKDSFDLADLDAHNCIEHDASLIREYPLSFSSYLRRSANIALERPRALATKYPDFTPLELYLGYPCSASGC